MDNLESKIFAQIKKTPHDIVPYEDMFGYARSVEPGDYKHAHSLNRELRRLTTAEIMTNPDPAQFFDLYKRTLLFDAPGDLDSYLLYLEMNRDPAERFYFNRRRVLKRVVDCLQMLVDDELDELFLSMPPRVGKTSLMIFFMSWVMGKKSECPNLYTSYTDTITKVFYNGVLEILTDKDTYLWSDVFPKGTVERTNAQDETIDIDRRKHYPTLTCRSIDGTLNGACDAENGIIIADDLVSGIEEAMSKDRLRSKWSKVDNNLIPRGKGKTKYCWIGTRWSILDPAGVRLDVIRNDDKFAEHRYKVINLPALNSKGESNFDYPHHVGFSTLDYQKRRASFERNNDMASWLAQYMGEPIEREGTLFTPDDFRYYNGTLPDVPPDRVFMAVDPAFGGGDFVAAPICFMYDNDIYVHDVVYSNADKRVTQPLLVNAIKKYNIAAVQIEANKSTETYVDGIEEELSNEGIRIHLTTKPAPTNKSKEQRIFDKAPDIRETMIFRESGKRSKEYELFMQNVYAFKMFAKNKHDDAPDSLSMAIDMAFGPTQIIKIFKRFL